MGSNSVMAAKLMKLRGGRVNVRTAMASPGPCRCSVHVGMVLSHSIRAMAMTEDDVLALADRFISAVAAGDLETVRSIYAPDAVMWNNYSRTPQTVDENLRILGWMTKNLKDMRYEDVRCITTSEGYVEQHVLRGTGPSGKELELPACLIVQVSDGRVKKLEEYFDSAALSALQ